jgi:hypothetical protein
LDKLPRNLRREGGIFAAQTTGGTDGDSDVAVPPDARFTAAGPARQRMAASQEP